MPGIDAATRSAPALTPSPTPSSDGGLGAVDANVSPPLNSGSLAFNAARAADVAALPSYETQAGAAGQSESYSESAARYCGSSHGTIRTPNLGAY